MAILLLGPELTHQTLCWGLQGGCALQLLCVVRVARVYPELAPNPLHRTGSEVGQEGNTGYKVRKAPRKGSWMRGRAEQRGA